jgi:hypothetical protein
MPSFESLFRESKGKPIVYKGQELRLVDLVPFAQGDRIRVTFERTCSEWRQGVGLKAPGAVEVAGQTINGPILLWEDTAPTETEIRILAPAGQLQVKNVWDTGDGVTHSWHHGAAMIVEELGSGGRRYRCNDGHPDEDFDDIVFRIDLLDVPSEMSVYCLSVNVTA